MCESADKKNTLQKKKKKYKKNVKSNTVPERKETARESNGRIFY